MGQPRKLHVFASLMAIAATPVAAEQANTTLPLAKQITAPHKRTRQTAKAHPSSPPQPWRLVDPGRTITGPSETTSGARAAGGTTVPTDPIEVGGKWTGNNDTAEKTRVQNYNGNATGSGGEVGLKLHF